MIPAMKPFDSLALAQGKLVFIGTAIASVVVVSLSGAPAAGPVKFEAHDIDPKLPGAYAVNIADFNKDGKIDVMANSLSVRELAWYENPTWERHVIVSDTMQ